MEVTPYDLDPAQWEADVVRWRSAHLAPQIRIWLASAAAPVTFADLAQVWDDFAEPDVEIRHPSAPNVVLWIGTEHATDAIGQLMPDLELSPSTKIEYIKAGAWVRLPVIRTLDDAATHPGDVWLPTRIIYHPPG